MAIGRRAGEGSHPRAPRRPAPPAPLAPVGPAPVPLWPPADVVAGFTLLQDCCVKCGRRTFLVRNLWPLLDPPATNELASVCEPCWQQVLVVQTKLGRRLRVAFWEAQPSLCPTTLRRHRQQRLQPPSSFEALGRLYRKEEVRVRIPRRNTTGLRGFMESFASHHRP
jgi:hypothetical protein